MTVDCEESPVVAICDSVVPHSLAGQKVVSSKSRASLCSAETSVRFEQQLFVGRVVPLSPPRSGIVSLHVESCGTRQVTQDLQTSNSAEITL